MKYSSLMSREEVLQGPEAIESFAEYSARVISAANEYVKERIPLDIDPGLAERNISWLKFTLEKNCLNRTAGEIASVNFYELGPSTRSVRGLVCTFPPDLDGVIKTARYEWDYLDPEDSSHQSTVITLTNPKTNEIEDTLAKASFSEDDLRTIELAVRGYGEDPDA